MSEADARILVIEDEPQMCRFLRASLTSHKYQVLEATNCAQGIAMATSHNPSLILMDLGLPDGDGIDLTKTIREWSQTPIIVVSARGREDDKVLALDAGADDYLTKPFGVNELLARIRVALRHSQKEAPTTTEYAFDGLRIDLVKREVLVDDQDVHLTPIEYNLLTLLAKNAGRVLTHRQILRAVWGEAYANQAHNVRVHMASLRKKIEKDPARPRFVTTEPGIGYRFRS
jgi:two-component system KDP operon response regulator KdpE